MPSYQLTMENFTTKAYGASGGVLGGKTLQAMEVQREGPKAHEVVIDVLYCGVCHSDIHQVANDWKNTIYPCVPGHEIVGRIGSVGDEVTRFKIGDIVGVGCMVDSCQECTSCQKGDEEFCSGPVGMTMTYNGYFKPDGKGFNTFGGYSTRIVANEKFLLRIPGSLDRAAVAPILCAGITTYSPLKQRGVKAGDKVGIIGIGGLGHMGVMIAKAMGATVVAITTSETKTQLAFALGADEVLLSTDADAMKAAEVSFDFLLCTIPYGFDVNPYVKLLGVRGSMVTVGLLGPYSEPTDNMEMAKCARSLGGSLIGGVAETQEVLDFCAAHNILPDVQVIDIQNINEAFSKIKDQDVRFRYVIDMNSLK